MSTGENDPTKLFRACCDMIVQAISLAPGVRITPSPSCPRILGARLNDRGFDVCANLFVWCTEEGSAQININEEHTSFLREIIGSLNVLPPADHVEDGILTSMVDIYYERDNIWFRFVYTGPNRDPDLRRTKGQASDLIGFQ